MNNTKIDWCTKTLNPVIGCTHGCPYCYARTMNHRFKYIPDFSDPQFFSQRLTQLSLKKPQIIFMDSMSDIADWQSDWIIQTFAAIAANPQHAYLFLTKRPQEVKDKITDITDNDLWQHEEFTADVFLGKSITRQSDLADDVFGTNIDFYSIEPILEPIEVSDYLKRNVMFYGDCMIRWVIIGAETGHRKNKVKPEKEWIRSIVSACREKGVPVFMKGSLKDLMGNEYIQEFPKNFDKQIKMSRKKGKRKK